MSWFENLRSRRLLRHGAGVVLDTAIAGGAFVLAYLTAYGYPRVLLVPALEQKTAAFGLACLVSFFLFSIHRGSWRYVSIPELIAIVKAAALAVALYVVAAFLATRGDNIPRSVPVLSFIYMVVFLSGARLAYRIAWERVGSFMVRRKSNEDGPRVVLLCGLTDNTESFIRLTRRGAGAFAVAGIIDDDPTHHGRTVQGVPVLGGMDDLDSVVSRLALRGVSASELVITEVAPTRARLSRIIERANAVSLKVSRIPDMTQMSEVTADQLPEPRPIEIGDLLGRPEVDIDLAGVAALIEGKVVLATGAGGSIGSELCRQIAAFRPSRLVITDYSEFMLFPLDLELRANYPDLDIVSSILDIRDARRVSAVMRDMSPQVVFHAAALKHVPLMEANPLEAVKTNVLGTRNVADAALANAVSTFVMISTDKAVNPTNVMGATKRAAEAYCQALDVQSPVTRFKTVRFGNVLGSNGSVVPLFREQIAAGGPVRVTHPEITRYFMTIPEAVRLVLHACAHALARRTERGQIMVLDMGEPVRIADLAERMIQLAGYRPGLDIEIVFTGLRPGEKLYEELFASSEDLDGQPEDGFAVASPRVIDHLLLVRTLVEIEQGLDREDAGRVLELLRHVVPEYRRAPTKDLPPLDTTG